MTQPSKELKKKRKIAPQDVRYVERYDFYKESKKSQEALANRPFYVTN